MIFRWETKAQATAPYSAVNSVYDFECMLKMGTRPSCKEAYLNQLQQVSEHLPLAVLLLS